MCLPNSCSCFVRFALAIAALPSLLAIAHAAVVWDETIQGDLSNDRLSPTSIPLSVGTNSILGTLTAFGDLEYFTVVVPEGHEFTSLTPSTYISEDGIAFIAVQAGAQMTVPTNIPDAEGLLGWTHFGDFMNNVGQNILSEMGTNGFGATGFIPPLPSGPYTFWVQQIDGLVVTYQFDFQIAALVEPSNGDYNDDGAVDAADYVVWRTSAGQNVPVGTGPDGSGPEGIPDGVVDSFDYDLWSTNFGAGGGGNGSQFAVPEPSTIATLCGVVGVIVCRRKRRSIQS